MAVAVILTATAMEVSFFNNSSVIILFILINETKPTFLLFPIAVNIVVMSKVHVIKKFANDQTSPEPMSFC